MTKYIKFMLNGEEVEAHVPVEMSMVDFLRKKMHLTGTKKGCEEGECGACTILVNEKPTPSCLLLAVEVDGCDVMTIEGLADGPKLHPLQQEFIDKWALQCGFCTPGMIMSAYALLKKNPNPTEYEIRDAIAGNLCRCTGYAKIVEAVSSAAKVLRERGE